MSISLFDLCAYLDEYLQVRLWTDYCFNGLQIEGKRKVERIATAVSTSLKAIEQAITLKADVLLVHHGLFWNKDSHVITGVKKEKIALLLQNDISLLAYHLPLDAHPEVGNNWKAANDLDWTNLTPFEVGVRGEFPEMTIEQFTEKLEDYYKHPAHVALGGKKKVSSAALISGGAHREISRAVSSNVDCFVTGSFDEPVWNIAFEEKINFFALGHAATECIGIQTLGNHLAKRFDLVHQFIDLTNPF